MKLGRAWLAWGLAVLAGPAWALETPMNAGGQAMPLENSAGSARALALGSAFVAVADDASALLWNPAGLGLLKAPELGVHHHSALGGGFQELGLASLPCGALGGLGFSFQYLNYGTFEGRDTVGALTSPYGASSMGSSLGWGKKWGGLGMGLSVKGLSQSLGPQSYSGFGGGAGLLWNPAGGLKIGLAYAHLQGPPGSSPAASLRAGTSLGFSANASTRILLAFSGAWEVNGVSRLQAGLESVLFSVFAPRVGFQLNLAENQISGLNGLTAGLGLSMAGLNLDYAYLPFGELGASQRLSLSHVFGVKKPLAGLQKD